MTTIGNPNQPGMPQQWHGLTLAVPPGFTVRHTEAGPYIYREQPNSIGQTLPTPGVLCRAIREANPHLP